MACCLKITDFVEEDMEWEKEECKKVGGTCEAYQLKTADAKELVNNCKDADVLFVDQARITSEVMDGLDQCKAIIRHGDGYEKLDLEAATRNGIICCNQPGVWSEEVAEQAVALLMATFKKLQIQRSVVIDGAPTGVFNRLPVKPLQRLSGKTLGVVGAGRVGSFVVQKMRGLGCNVLVHDPVASAETLSKLGVDKSVDFDELLEQSDLISIHCPLTENTKGMFDKTAFSKMKKSAVLVNTARGPIVDGSALIEALTSGQIAGAGLDVFPDDKEPPAADSPLLKMDNVILSPHLGWYSEDALLVMRQRNMDEYHCVRQGKRPRNVLNPDVFESPKCRLKTE